MKQQPYPTDGGNNGGELDPNVSQGSSTILTAEDLLNTNCFLTSVRWPMMTSRDREVKADEINTSLKPEDGAVETSGIWK